MDTQQQLVGLIVVAEDHQKAVKAAIDGLAKDRAALALAAASLAGVAGEVRAAAGQAVRESLAGASGVAVKALGEASKPLVEQLSGVVKAAGEAEGQLSKAMAGFSWRWALLAAGAAAGGIAVLLLAAWLAVWWERRQVEQLTDQKAALLGEVAQLQANVAALAKKGGRIVMTTCGGRMCIEASSNQGNGIQPWTGPWNSKETGVQLVIPKGY